MATFLITGHGRSGTHYLADLFNYYGYKIGGGKMGPDGISGNQLGHPDMPCGGVTRRSLSLDYLIHGVRNPWHTAESDYISKGAPSEVHAKYIPQISREDRLEQTIMSILLWSRQIVALRPHLTVRVESAEVEVKKWLDNNWLKSEPVSERFSLHDIPRYDDDLSKPPKLNVNSRYEQHHEHWKKANTPTKEDYNSVDPRVMERFHEHCRRFGYPDTWESRNA